MSDGWKTKRSIHGTRKPQKTRTRKRARKRTVRSLTIQSPREAPNISLQPVSQHDRVPSDKHLSPRRQLDDTPGPMRIDDDENRRRSPARAWWLAESSPLELLVRPHSGSRQCVPLYSTRVAIHHVVPPASLTPPRLSSSSFFSGVCTEVAPSASARL